MYGGQLTSTPRDVNVLKLIQSKRNKNEGARGEREREIDRQTD